MTEKSPEPTNKHQHPNLRPPESGPITHRTKPTSRPMWFLISFILITLLGIACFLIFYTPDPTPTENTAISSLPSNLPVTSTAPLPAQPDASKLEAQQTLKKWLLVKTKLDAEEADIWGDKLYKNALIQAHQGDQLFNEKKYPEANTGYLNALKTLKQLESQKDIIFQQALHNGAQALKANMVTKATNELQKALSAYPESTKAADLMTRVNNRSRVLELLTLGKKMSDDNDLAKAVKYYQDAFTLDPLYLPAATFLSHSKLQLADIQFKEAMSLFLQALQEKNLSLAQTKLNQAGSLRPEDQSVLDGRERLKGLIVSQKIEILRQQIEKYSERENWTELIKSCEQALTIAPLAGFAVECHQRGKQLLTLNNAIVSILTQPQRLQNNASLLQAEQTLNWARSISNPGPQLRQITQQLEDLLVNAKQKSEIIINSDNQTEVAIYHIGRLGRFKQKTIQLLPGTYTIVGTRSGYRDVRKQFEITAQETSKSVTINCEEPI